MLIKLSDWFYKNSQNNKLVVGFLLLDLVFMAGVMPQLGMALATEAGRELNPLDLHLMYTPSEAVSILDGFGENGRALYRNIELSVDIIYPIIYTVAFGLLISWLFARLISETNWFWRANLLPVGALLFDLFENTSIAILINGYPNPPLFVATLASIFTPIKWFFAFASILLIVFGLAGWLIKRFAK